MPAVQIPRTATRRGAAAVCVLIDRVNLNPRVPGLMAWDGPRFRPGDAIDSGLVPNGKLLLEATEVEDPSGHAKRRYWTLMYVLWQFDGRLNGWAEVTRVKAPLVYGGVQELRQLAARMLGQDTWRELESLTDTVERINAYLDSEISSLGDRCGPVLELVIHRMAAKVVDIGSVRRPAARPPRWAESAG